MNSYIPSAHVAGWLLCTFMIWEYIETKELVRGTVFDGEDVEILRSNVFLSVDGVFWLLLSVHAAFYGVLISRFGTVNQPGGQI